MGEVRFVRQLADGKDLIFAFAGDGSPAWAIERGTGQQWWYAGGDQPAVRNAITESWNAFATMPVAEPAVGPQCVVGGSPAPSDLLAHRPGHAVLAKIAELHATAVAATGVPVLPDEIVSWSVGFVGEEATGAEVRRLGPE